MNIKLLGIASHCKSLFRRTGGVCVKVLTHIIAITVPALNETRGLVRIAVVGKKITSKMR